MPQYMLLIYSPEERWEAAPEGEREAVLAEYGQLVGELQQRGAMRGGAQLQPTSTATCVRVREGEPLVTDGPFAETKEQLGGYFLVQAESLDAALEWAEKIPTARAGTVEVRPIVERDGGRPE
jgi:hypothetical protein